MVSQFYALFAWLFLLENYLLLCFAAGYISRSAGYGG
jgi:hypothetical protein